MNYFVFWLKNCHGSVKDRMEQSKDMRSLLCETVLGREDIYPWQHQEKKNVHESCRLSVSSFSLEVRSLNKTLLAIWKLFLYTIQTIQAALPCLIISISLPLLQCVVSKKPFWIYVKTLKPLLNGSYHVLNWGLSCVTPFSFHNFVSESQ